ncbi:MAG: flagellar basal body-associated FliL family protein [Burkholderiales bacterium]|nr:flagellar basal body-associated FliL family protein [Burkholderiales bacterium]MDE2076320.1 flagellar basal body-associated FliL family protein [Burkholderiales bacterium]MDE2433251.1 flagellar basal body-associated FliL family protein [Burkholderiales bacterium]
MSAAPAATAEGEAPKKGPKKLIIIIAVAVLVLLLGGGGAAYFIFKKKAHDAAADGGDGDVSTEDVQPEKPKRDSAHPPTFIPLDPFVVNLSDKDTERYAQVGISLQVEDPKMSEEMKAYMPAIKDSIILILSHKTSDELLTLEGKQKMAEEIRRAAARAMGYNVPEPEETNPDEVDTSAPKKKKRKKKKAEPYNPIEKVVYSSFIVQ